MSASYEPVICSQAALSCKIKDSKSKGPSCPIRSLITSSQSLRKNSATRLQVSLGGSYVETWFE